MQKAIQEVRITANADQSENTLEGIAQVSVYNQINTHYKVEQELKGPEPLPPKIQESNTIRQ